jgi:hypothetical protein
MELTLIEKTNQTRIKVSLKKLPLYERIIKAYIQAHGGREERRTTRYVYFIIDADVIYKGRYLR